MSNDTPSMPDGASAARLPPPRVLFLSRSCLLDDSNGAAVAGRALVRGLAGRGWAVEVFCGPTLDGGEEADVGDWLAGRGFAFEEAGGGGELVDARGGRAVEPPRLRLVDAGVPVTVHRGSTAKRSDSEGLRDEFLRLFDEAVGRTRPDLVVGYGGDPAMRAAFAGARRLGIAAAFELHNFQYRGRDAFADVDAVRVPSRFAAEHDRRAIGLDCMVLPNLVDLDRVRVEAREPRFVTFVNPSAEKGVWAFARIADELGRLRPDIPLLVVESRGTEGTLAACGLDLRARGNVFLMANTPDPRRFLRLSRLCLMPSLWRESQGLAAVEAMLNGIPVIASDRGALPETLVSSGLLLPLPDRLTPASRTPPTAEEVAPWVDAVIRFWDSPDLLREHARRSLDESSRWLPEVLLPRYERFFREVAGRGAGPIPAGSCDCPADFPR
jgi:glycosyltransferase involved in cell wall biosynthesis